MELRNVNENSKNNSSVFVFCRFDENTWNNFLKWDGASMWASWIISAIPNRREKNERKRNENEEGEKEEARQSQSNRHWDNGMLKKSVWHFLENIFFFKFYEAHPKSNEDLRMWNSTCQMGEMRRQRRSEEKIPSTQNDNGIWV